MSRPRPSTLAAFFFPLAILACVAADQNESGSVRARLEWGSALAACDWPSAGIYTGADRSTCTATLIAPRWMLTAAHCATGGSFAVAGQTVATLRCIEHPDFVASQRVYDFRVCELASAVTVPIIPLMTPCEAAELADPDGRALLRGTPVTVVGAGQPSVGSRRAGPMEVGAAIYSSPLIDFSSPTSTVGARGGDSGGPTFLTMGDGTLRQVGVHHEGAVGWRVLDAFVPAAFPWIEQATGVDLSPCHSGATWAPGAGCAALPSAVTGLGGAPPACQASAKPPRPTCVGAAAPDAGSTAADASVTPDGGGARDASAGRDGSAPTGGSEAPDTGLEGPDGSPETSAAPADASDGGCSTTLRRPDGAATLLASLVAAAVGVRRRRFRFGRDNQS